MELTRRPFCAAFVSVVSALFFALTGEGMGGIEAGRFFLAGDGAVRIRNVRTGEEVCVNLLRPDGSLDEESFNRIDAVFGFPTREKEEHVSPRLIFMLDYFSDLVAPGEAIQLESGYRSPEYNDGIRKAGANAARTSQHMDGMAIDFRIEGVDGKKLWEIIRSKDCCGVGHYGGAIIHLDSAKPRFWEAATSKTRTRESDYNRKIYLATDYDRYRPGDVVRLSFSSVSNFGFGIRPVASLVLDPDGNATVATVPVTLGEIVRESPCLPVEDRKTSRFMHLLLPSQLSPGRYRFKIDFCNRPFPEMPLAVVSNEIEVSGAGK
ncbi:MAG: DUF882 domain-containing protein [Deltaproteobacteria bacterium]|nr:DUF882 domain-containing protein [Deltaproteobacteria bacterium]